MRVVAYNALDASTIMRRPTRIAFTSSGMEFSDRMPRNVVV
jgi:hypothetical protein